MAGKDTGAKGGDSGKKPFIAPSLIVHGPLYLLASSAWGAVKIPL